MAKSIQLNVDIKTKYQEQLTKIKDIKSGLSAAHGFDNHLGKERLNKINSLTSDIEHALNLDNLSFEELTTLKKNFNELFEVLETVANGVEVLTPKMRELQDSLKKVEQEVETAAKKRDEVVTKGKLSKTGKSFVNIEGFNERVAKLGAFRQRKDGTLYKQSLTDFENVFNRIKDKDPDKREKIYTADGKLI